MTNNDKKIQLVKYRLQQGKESIEEAEFLLSGKKSPRSIINRAYYSMFYAVLALLIFEPFSSSKHSGVLSYFNRRFIKGGIFPKELGRSINKAYELRQIGDYREYTELTYEHVKPFIEEAKIFVKAIKNYLENNILNK